MRLISMTDYVLDLAKSNDIENWRKQGMMIDYAKFLKQPLKLEMFVPCDEDGNVIDNPEERDDYAWDIVYEELKIQGYSVGSEEESDITITKAKKIHIERYQKAKEKVLFKDMKYDDYYEQVYEDGGRIAIDLLLDDVETIEDLIPFDLELTDNAIKQLGL